MTSKRVILARSAVEGVSNGEEGLIKLSVKRMPIILRNGRNIRVELQMKLPESSFCLSMRLWYNQKQREHVLIKRFICQASSHLRSMNGWSAGKTVSGYSSEFLYRDLVQPGKVSLVLSGFRRSVGRVTWLDTRRCIKDEKEG